MGSRRKLMMISEINQNVTTMTSLSPSAPPQPSSPDPHPRYHDYYDYHTLSPNNSNNNNNNIYPHILQHSTSTDHIYTHMNHISSPSTSTSASAAIISPPQPTPTKPKNHTLILQLQQHLQDEQDKLRDMDTAYVELASECKYYKEQYDTIKQQLHEQQQFSTAAQHEYE